MRCLNMKRILLPVLISLYVGTWLFALLNGRARCKITRPFYSPSSSHEDSMCFVDLITLHLANIDIFDSPPFYKIEQDNPDVNVGGAWKPDSCQSLQKVAIIIPYRDGEEHLQILLKRLHPMLQRQRIYYRIFVIEQFGNELFNRGKLLNVGYLEALNVENFDCFIFHDTDLIPEHDQNIYLCDQHARHLSSAIDEMRYQYQRFLEWRSRWATDGLNDTKGMMYKVTSNINNKLYTNISVDIGSPSLTKDTPAKVRTRESYWWLFQFYFP